MEKLIRITTIPLSLEKLLEGQLAYMNQFFEVIAVSAEKERLEKYGRDNKLRTYWVEMTRAITPYQDLKAVLKLYRFLKKEKPLIVHTHTPKAGIVGMVAAKMAGVPVRLHTVAGLPLLETTGFKRKLLSVVEQITYRCATKIYPNSQGLKEIILRENFTSSNKIKLLGTGSSNGIDTRYFDPQKFSEEQKRTIRNGLNIPPEDIVLIFIGRLVSEKGINELVASFARVSSKFPSTSLLLVGPFEKDLDPLKQNTFNTIQEHPKIFTTGYQQDVRPYLAVADLLVFPSYREGFPNVVLQAGAMGLPSIVSDINGCNEIIRNGYNGIIIPKKDEEALYEAVVLLLKDNQLRIQLSEQVREEIRKKYERSQFWQRLKEEYDQITAEIPS